RREPVTGSEQPGPEDETTMLRQGAQTMRETNTTRGVGRRELLGAGLALPAMTATSAVAAAPGGARQAPQPARPDRRRLGALEVSSIGLGVQNMTRTYQTTIPTRPEMINIIRAA